MRAALRVRNLHVSLDGRPILRGVNLVVRLGEIHVLSGPDGAGKSWLVNVIAGHPRLRVEQGEISFDGEDLVPLSADQRARRGVFLGFQYPVVLPGVTVSGLLSTALSGAWNENPLPPADLNHLLAAKMSLLGLPHHLASGYVNEGLTLAEKRRLEILQLAMLRPRLALLDEMDEELSVEAVRALAGPKVGLLLASQSALHSDAIRPDFVHLMRDGQVVMSGGPELARTLVERGSFELPEEARHGPRS
jgi:Fe-S cluster assembly ATP-binding protein